MKSRRQGFLCCWILAGIIVAMFSQNIIQCQPQQYFKGSQITQLPSKALPRIGRRSGSSADTSPDTESSETTYSFQIPASDSYAPEIYRRMVDQENLETLSGSNPKLILLLKRIFKDKVLRNEEPIGIIRNRNE